MGHAPARWSRVNGPGGRHLVPTASHFGSYLADTRDGVLHEMHPGN